MACGVWWEEYGTENGLENDEAAIFVWREVGYGNCVYHGRVSDDVGVKNGDGEGVNDTDASEEANGSPLHCLSFLTETVGVEGTEKNDDEEAKDG